MVTVLGMIRNCIVSKEFPAEQKYFLIRVD